MRLLRAWATLALDHYKVIISLLAVLASAFYGFAFAHFYSELNTSSEAVGISAPQMVARSAFGGVAFLLAGAVFGTGFIGPSLAVASSWRASAEESNGGLGDVVIMTMLCAVSAVVCLLLGEGRPVPLLIIAFLFVPFFLRYRRRAPWIAGVRSLRLRISMFGLTAMAWAMVTLLILATYTISWADYEGEQAKAGNAVSPVDFLGFSMLGVQADPAFVHWLGKPRGAPHLPNCVSYLGKNGSSLVIYDPIRHRTVQIPSEEVALSMEEGRTSCRAPRNLQAPKLRQVGRYLKCELGQWSRLPQPKFSVSWTADGFPIEAPSKGKFPLYLFAQGSEIQCEVEATSELGSDVAYSPQFVRPAHLVVSARRKQHVATSTKAHTPDHSRPRDN